MRSRQLLLVLLFATAVQVRAQSQDFPPAARLAAEEQPASPPAPPSDPGRAASDVTAPALPKSPPNAGVQASQLDTFLLRDGKGNLVPVLGMPFEEFEQLLRAKKGLAAPASPAFTLEKLSLTGSVEGPVADLAVVATIRLRREGWVSIPLLMPSAVIRQPEKYEGPGEHFFSFDRDLGGYALWLKGGGEVPHVLSLQVSSAVERAGLENRLSIQLPHANESSLRLTTSQSALQPALSSGEGIVISHGDQESSNVISVIGPAGDVRLAWRAGAEKSSLDVETLDASGEIAVRVESQHRITSDARLRVRSFRTPLDSFRVRLPPNMELVPLPPSGGFTVKPVNSASGMKGSAKSPTVVLVKLDKPTLATTEILLRTQLKADVPNDATTMPARFEVLDAVRQRGTIDFTVDGQWQLDWTEDKTVHRLDLTPDTAAARIVARYEYFKQPCGLGLKVSVKASRTSVEPTHMVFVDRQRVRIESMLRYRFRGARTEKLRFEMGEWTFDRLSPDTLLDLPTAKEGETGVVDVPLRAGASPPTELELKLEAHRSLPVGTGHLDLSFPRPIADIVAPATIVVFPADNLELTPLVDEIVGLTPDATSLRVPGREQQPLVYRDLGGDERARFAAEMRMLGRTVTTSAKASVRLDHQQAQIEQRLEYRVAHEPQRTFSLMAPRELIAGGGIEVWLEDESLTVAPVATANDTEFGHLQFSTPTDRLGAFAVTIRYAIPVPWDGQNSLPINVPLVLPDDKGDEPFAGQRVEFWLPEGVQVEQEGGESGELARPTATEGNATAAFSLLRPAAFSRWVLEPSPASQPSGITVPQLWVQTWLTPQLRQERVALRLVTSQETIRIRLPKGTRPSSIRTAIDGQLVRNNLRDPGVLVVGIPPSQRGRSVVMEVTYSVPFDAAQATIWSTPHDLRAAPQVEEASPPQRTYWQLVLPQDQRLLVTPPDMASEMVWSRVGWSFAERPVFDQRQLEVWIKATRQEPLPQGVNEYLFGGIGRWPTLTAVVAPRWLTVVVASSFALILGLLLLHVPATRTPYFFLVLAVGLTAVAMVSPQVFLILAQGAALGLAIVVLATGLAWATADHRYAPRSAVISRAIDTGAVSTPSAARAQRSSRITATAPSTQPLVEARP